MRIEQLQYLYEVVNCKSMSIASENLFTTQPNISKNIKALEEELNLQLITREKNNICLTKEGKVVLEYAKIALAQINNITDFALAHNGDAAKDLEGMLKIVYPPQFKGILAQVFSDFHEKHNKVHFDFIEYNAARIIEMLPENSFDIYFINIMKDDEQTKETLHNICGELYTIQFLYSEEMFLSVSKTHPLATRKSVSLKDLSAIPLGTIKPENEDLDYFSQLLKDKYHCTFSIRSNTSELLHKHILKGHCASLTSKNSSLYNADTILIPLKESLCKSLYCVYCDDPEKSAFIQTFMNTVYNVMKQKNLK